MVGIGIVNDTMVEIGVVINLMIRLRIGV